MAVVRREIYIEYNYNAGEIELAVADHFDPRQNLIVPNVAHGMGLHECDVLILSQSGYATEVEIKISAGDLKADAKKSHKHNSNMIKALYFAIPEYLKDYISYIPNRAGIILIKRVKNRYWDFEKQKTVEDGEKNICEIIRAANINRNVEKWTDEDRLALMRLSTLRIWSLKRKIMLLQKNGRTNDNRAEGKTV